MKRFTLILLAVIAVTAFVGCTGNSVEARIENELKEYVKANFDDPREFEKIVSITAKDTFTVEKLHGMIGNLLLVDSMVTANKESIWDGFDNELGNRFGNLSYEGQQSVKSERLRFGNAANVFIEKMYGDNEHDEFVKSLTACLSDTTINFNTTEYEVKFRVLKDDKLTIQTYYAQVDNLTGDIKISDKTAQKGAFGERVNEVYELLDKALENFSKRGDIVRELRDSYIEYAKAVNRYS